MRKIKKLFLALKKKSQKVIRKVLAYINLNPLRAFFIALGLLVVVIILASILRKPGQQVQNPPAETKSVQVYDIGSVPSLSVQAKVEKSGVITITALTSGVVQSIDKREGDSVGKGQTVVEMANNYQGGNSFSLNRQLAQSQYNNVQDTYQEQKDLISRQRDLANQSDDNADQLRDITNKSVDETQTLISDNNDIISSLDQQIQTLEANPQSPSNDALILSAKEMKSQFVASTNAANEAVRSAQYQGDSTKPPSQLSDTQKDIANKQLDLQQKMLDLTVTVSKIQLQIAQVNEAMMFPSSPFNGTVQKVFVKEGEAVNPGTKLMIIQQNTEKDPITAAAFVPLDIAQKVSLTEKSRIYLNSKTSFEATPTFVSQEAIEGDQYAVFFSIPDDYIKDVTDNGSVNIDLSIGYLQTTESSPYVPVDAVYQTRQESYVFVNDHGVAKSKKVQLGDVFGDFVQVESGLLKGDEVILNRNIIEGDKLKI